MESIGDESGEENEEGRMYPYYCFSSALKHSTLCATLNVIPQALPDRATLTLLSLLCVQNVCVASAVTAKTHTCSWIHVHAPGAFSGCTRIVCSSGSTRAQPFTPTQPPATGLVVYLSVLCHLTTCLSNLCIAPLVESPLSIPWSDLFDV